MVRILLFTKEVRVQSYINFMWVEIQDLKKFA